MRVFSYVVASDSGFAPHPFGRYCTLACCKPVIRRVAAVGDWVVGLSRGSRGIVYAMRVTGKMDFAAYWRDRRFRHKRPDMNSGRVRRRCGDNIYEPLPGGGFRQQHSGHSYPDGSEHPWMKKRDLGGRFVLVSDEFSYFGREAPPLPAELSFLRVGRGHRSRFTAEEVQAVVEHLSSLPRGTFGRPARWPAADRSWRAC
jgi:hypothetical protein